MSNKKSPNLEQFQVGTPEQKEHKELASTPEIEGVTTQIIKQEESPTSESIQEELSNLKETVLDHANQMTPLHDALTRKRKLTPNGKTQTLDQFDGG